MCSEHRALGLVGPCDISDFQLVYDYPKLADCMFPQVAGGMSECCGLIINKLYWHTFIVWVPPTKVLPNYVGIGTKRVPSTIVLPCIY